MSETTLAKQDSKVPAETKRITYMRPQYEVHQDGDYFVQVYMPGVAKEGVNIMVDNKTLSIEGQRKPLADASWRPTHREIPTADYRLRLELNIPVDEGKITAQTENGVLILKLPVEEAAKPRKITVS